MQVRNTRKGVIGGTALVLVVALVLATDVWAQPGFQDFGGPMAGGRRGMLAGLRQLELTDAQREQIREISDQNRADGRALAEGLRAAREALNEAVTADVVNESTIRGLVAQVAPLEADVAVQRAYANAQILQVLTPDQRAELRQLQAEAQEHFRERQDRERQDRR